MLRKIPQLDAVRGIAILVVILHNEAGKYPSLRLEPIFANGWMGVDLFFVLSGFLITGLLLDTKKSGSHIKDFYARRCLRIFPLYYCVLFFMFVLVPLLRPSEAGEIFARRSQPWWAYPLFLQNFLVAVPENATGPLGVTWSLGIEELFYAVWPWIVRQGSLRRLRWGAMAVIGASPVLRLILGAYGVNLYSNPFCRLDGLMAGAFLASMVRTEGFDGTRFVGVAWIILAVMAPLAFIAEAANARWLVFSLVAIASGSFVYLALFDGHGWFVKALSNRFLIYTGTISYGLYLLHKIPFDILQVWGPMDRPLLEFSLGLVACYVAAFLSWTLLESPFLRLKRFFRSSAPQPETAASPLVVLQR